MTNLDDNYKSYVQYLNDAAPKFKDYLIQHLKNARSCYEDNKHKDVDKYLYQPLIEFSKNAGKMHRPLTCLAAFNALKTNQSTEVVLPVAAAIEHFQSAALIHDDIADGGEIRRSKPCLHKQIGVGLAINAGDFGLAMVIPSVIRELENLNVAEAKILQIVDQLSLMEYMTIEGQAMDLGWARDGQFDISIADYCVMATKKSAYYSVSVPCVLGAICADASTETISAIQDFGLNLGLAFQIQDDLLNLIDEGKSTKDFLNDITEGKRTLVVCKTLELSKDKDELIDILKSCTKDAAKLKRAVEIMQECGAIDFAKDLAKNLSQQSREILDKALPSSN